LAPPVINDTTKKDIIPLSEGFDPKTEKVGDYMTSPLRTASHRTRIYKLEEMFLGLILFSL
jgi:hypothetical protein